MAKKVEIEITKQYGGASNAETWSNTYSFIGPDDIYDPAYEDTAELFANKEANFHMQQVHFTRALIRYAGKGATKGGTVNANSIPFNFLGKLPNNLDVNQNDLSLPGEICVVGIASGQGVRGSRMLYRFCIPGDSWHNVAGAASLTYNAKELVQNAFNQMREGVSPTLKWISGGAGSTVATPHYNTKFLYGGLEHRQLSQSRTGKKGVNANSDRSILDTIKQATGIASDIVTIFASRSNPAVATVLALPTTKRAVGALVKGAEDLYKAIDTNDYGDTPALPPAGG